MGGVGNAIGSAVGTGLDVLLNRPGASAGAIPKKLLLSSKISISIRGMNGESLEVAQWDQMRKQKILEEKKRFKPYGSMKTISLSKDLGWELNVSGLKTDGQLDRLIHMQEKMLNGTGISSLPGNANTFNSNGIIGIKPLFEVSEIISENDGGYTIFIYEDVSIIGFDETVPADNSPIEYSLTLFSPTRKMVETSYSNDNTITETVLDKIINDLVNRNKQ